MRPLFLTELFAKRNTVRKRPRSSRQRRFSFLLIYSHGTTRTLSFSLTTLVAATVALCLSLVKLGFFIHASTQTAKECDELNYLYDVAGLQEQQIRALEEHIFEVAERLRQTELSESETRSMLRQEDLLNEGTSDLNAVIATRQVLAATTSRAGTRTGPIPVKDMGSALDSLDLLVLSLDTRVSLLEDRLGDLRVIANEAVSYARAKPSIWPVYGSITSKFGTRRHPLTGRQHFHEGIDIGAQYRTPVRVTADGTVKFAGLKSGYGYTVEVDHGYGFKTTYSHCSSLAVTPGQKVTRGDTIAYVGSSGVSTGPHLHYEVSKDTTKQDPVDYLPH